MDDAMLPEARLPAQWLRRLAVVLQYAGAFAGAGLWLASRGPGPEPLFLSALACLIVSLLSFSWLSGRYLFLATASDCALDEREQERRNRANFYAFHVLGTLAMALTLLNVVALDLGWPAVDDERVAIAVMLLTVLMVFTLPGALLAWNEPSDAPATMGRPGGATPGAFWRRVALLAGLGFVVGFAGSMLI
jgi:hypothetical protein